MTAKPSSLFNFFNKQIKMIEQPPNKTCLQCNRKTVYPEKMFGDWFYPREQTCFDCLMIGCNRFDKIRARKLPGKMNDTAELIIPSNGL